MPWTDERYRFLVEDVLGVRPEPIARMVERVERRHPPEERGRALARMMLPRTIFSSVATGLSGDLRRAVAMALIEQRASMRQRASFLAALEYLEDASFFTRDDWPRIALGLEGDDTGAELALREAARFVGRLVITRGARRLGAIVPPPLAGLAGSAAGALFNIVEVGSFAASALNRPRRGARREVETSIVALSSPWIEGQRIESQMEEQSK